MKLLIDQNLSRRLVEILAADFPDTKHVLHLGMEKKEDTEIWDFAAANDFVIVSKDKDFCQGTEQ
jgi:predicted nuclease of predicted toxin-antitoxin system